MDLEHILQKLDRIEKLQENMLARLDAHFSGQSAKPENQWIDSIKVCEILGISESTLYRIRKRKIIVSHQIGGRHYYYTEDILSAAKMRIK